MVAILNADILPNLRMTVDEYLEAELPEGYRYELVEGVVEMTPVPGIPHDSVVEQLHRLFVRYADERPDIVSHVTQRCAVTLADRQTVREPDFAVYGPGDMGDKSDKTWKDVTPILVVEVVSAGQAERDYQDGRCDYWDAGVGAYWIVDPQERALTVLTRGAADWQAARVEADAVYWPEAFAGLEIPVGRVLGV